MNKNQKALNKVKEKFVISLQCLSLKDKNKQMKYVKILQELVDKATPKKPPLTWECAKTKTRCKCTAGVEKYHSYCWNCGQALDWSKENE